MSSDRSQIWIVGYGGEGDPALQGVGFRLAVSVDDVIEFGEEPNER